MNRPLTCNGRSKASTSRVEHSLFGLVGDIRTELFVFAEKWMVVTETSAVAIPGDICEREPVDDLGIRLLGDGS